ncbi:TrkA family potassium uptake protein [bacterium]|nr:MAG: TrkA family potassium uptake protein [bacterium]
MYVMIVGCGRVGAEVAKILSTEGHNVVVIDKNTSSFDRLGSGFNGLALTGSGFDLDFLKEAGIEKADAFCALTNGDNTNLVCSQIARKIFKVPKVFARVYDPQRAHIYSSLGLGLNIISGSVLFAAMLRDKIIESRFSSYLIESKDLGVIEISAKDASLTGQTVTQLNIPGEFIVVAIRRIDGVIIPKDDTAIKEKDTLIALVKVASLDKIRKQFNLNTAR